MEPIELAPRKTSVKLEAEKHARERAQQVAAQERDQRKRKDRDERRKGSKDTSSASTSAMAITPADLAELIDFDKRDDPKQVELLRSSRFGGLAGIAKALHTDLERGLARDDDFAVRRTNYGSNTVPLPEPVGLLQLIIENLSDRILQILLVGALLNLAFGMIFDGVKKGWIEGVAILIAVMIVVAFTSGNNWLKERKFRAIFLLQSKRQVKIKRGGETGTFDSSEVMVGDVIELFTGDEVPADGLFISGNRFSVDESALTGETVPVKKNDSLPFMFAGTAVAEGSGLLLVTAVGERSTAGQIQALLNEQRKEQTPLQEKLAKMANEVGFFGISLASLTFFVLTVRWLATTFTADAFYSWGDFEDIIRYFVLAVTLIVVAVPEGLPLAVTISLAYSMQKMIKDNNFVRHLAASETMGEVTTICSDKTGTLTENRMTVVSSYIGASEDPAALHPEMRQLFNESVALNSTAFVETANGKTNFIGNKTEGALLLFCMKQFECNYAQIRERFRKEGEIPFSSARKRMSTAVRKNGQLVLHCKGAAEIVLELCTSLVDAQGRQQPMTPELAKTLRERIDGYASSGLRTLTLAYRNVTDAAIASDAALQEAESSLVLLGIVGIKDPVRAEVPPAVAACQRAGVRVRMVTGDNRLTAEHIARECGILTEGGLVYEGPAFRALSRQAMDEVLPKLQVLARSSPQDKFLLVSRLKELNEVVAVTGDGTNDGLALKEADVGIAMGIAGTDIAKNASDIVLLDDNFRSIVRAMLWGRNVFDCIRKFLQFQLGVNVIAIMLTMIGAIARGAAPLRPVQLLWVNLIMDTFGALALATDPPSENLLTRPPHKRKENVVTTTMLLYMAGQFVYQMVVLLVILFAGHLIFGVEYSDFRSVHTFVFCVFVFMQVVNMFHARCLSGDSSPFDGLTKNPRFIVLMGCIVVVQVIVIMFAGAFMTTKPMNGKEWGIAIAFIAPSIAWGWVVRQAIRVWERAHPVHADVSV